MVTILMMPAKMATLGLLRIKVFQNKDYDVIVSVHGDHQQNFTTRIRLYCKCSHVTKVW